MNRRERQVICALVLEGTAVLLQKYADYKLAQLGVRHVSQQQNIFGRPPPTPVQVVF